jgi:hypothetical protein
MTCGDGFGIAGLVLDIAGATVFGWGVLTTTKAEAVDVTVARFASEDPDEMAALPAAKDRLRQRTYGLIGLGLLIGGFVLQIISYLLP